MRIPKPVLEMFAEIAVDINILLNIDINININIDVESELQSQVEFNKKIYFDLCFFSFFPSYSDPASSAF